MSDKFNLPPEIIQALAYASIAEEVLEPVIGVAEKIHSLGLGKKAGRLLGIVAAELTDLFNPLTQLMDQRRTRMREERMDFIAKHVKESSTGTCPSPVEMQQVALSVLKMEQNEYALLWKTIENEIWKFRATSAKDGSKETWSLSNLGNLVKKN